MGRNSKPTPEVHGKIVAQIGRGAWDYVAAQTAGIKAGTFREWIARGEGRDPKRPCTKALAAFAAARPTRDPTRALAAAGFAYSHRYSPGNTLTATSPAPYVECWSPTG